MEEFVIIAILCGLGYWAFRVGKREGSRQGFGAGRRRERRRSRRDHPRRNRKT